jgi:hypothetical protein
MEFKLKEFGSGQWAVWQLAKKYCELQPARRSTFTRGTPWNKVKHGHYQHVPPCSK